VLLDTLGPGCLDLLFDVLENVRVLAVGQAMPCNLYEAGLACVVDGRLFGEKVLALTKR
jgi:hypothetical protein